MIRTKFRADGGTASVFREEIVNLNRSCVRSIHDRRIRDPNHDAAHSGPSSLVLQASSTQASFQLAAPFLLCVDQTVQSFVSVYLRPWCRSPFGIKSFLIVRSQSLHAADKKLDASVIAVCEIRPPMESLSRHAFEQF